MGRNKIKIGTIVYENAYSCEKIVGILNNSNILNRNGRICTIVTRMFDKDNLEELPTSSVFYYYPIDIFLSQFNKNKYDPNEVIVKFGDIQFWGSGIKC